MELRSCLNQSKQAQKRKYSNSRLCFGLPGLQAQLLLQKEKLNEICGGHLM